MYWVGESLQEFATTVKQLACCAYPALPEDHVRREVGKAFADGVEDPNIKIQLLLGGEKTVTRLSGRLFSKWPDPGMPGHSGGADALNWEKRPPTTGMLELWEARPLLG
jgi:hypothetical protein